MEEKTTWQLSNRFSAKQNARNKETKTWRYVKINNINDYNNS